MIITNPFRAIVEKDPETAQILSGYLSAQLGTPIDVMNFDISNISEEKALFLSDESEINFEQRISKSIIFISDVIDIRLQDIYADLILIYGDETTDIDIGNMEAEIIMILAPNANIQVRHKITSYIHSIITGDTVELNGTVGSLNDDRKFEIFCKDFIWGVSNPLYGLKLYNQGVATTKPFDDFNNNNRVIAYELRKDMIMLEINTSLSIVEQAMHNLAMNAANAIEEIPLPEDFFEKKVVIGIPPIDTNVPRVLGTYDTEEVHMEGTSSQEMKHDLPEKTVEVVSTPEKQHTLPKDKTDESKGQSGHRKKSPKDIGTSSGVRIFDDNDKL